MNLIQHHVHDSVVANFRSFQYGLSLDLIQVGMNYLIKHGLEYDPAFYDPNDQLSIQIVEDFTYCKIKHYAQKILKIKIKDDKNWFMYIGFPDLLDGTFFRLNSTLYCPLYYIQDEPIVLKEKSIVLQSLFYPITLYFNDNRAIFMGNNIMLNTFLQLLTNDWPLDARKILTGLYDVDYSRCIKTNIQSLSEKLNVEESLEAIKDKINSIFFDDWTKQLYEQFYNIEPTIDNVLKIAMFRKWKMATGEFEKPSFIDLRYKRLTFIEPILRPFFKAVSWACGELVRGNQPKSLKMNDMAIISKKFFSDLNGRSWYDTVNGFSSILAHRASFENPFGTSRLPSEVSSIHWTHMGKICPNSITNQKPGYSVSLIPDQDIDLKFGIFDFTEEELERP